MVVLRRGFAAAASSSFSWPRPSRAVASSAASDVVVSDVSARLIRRSTRPRPRSRPSRRRAPGRPRRRFQDGFALLGHRQPRGSLRRELALNLRERFVRLAFRLAVAFVVALFRRRRVVRLLVVAGVAAREDGRREVPTTSPRSLTSGSGVSSFAAMTLPMISATVNDTSASLAARSSASLTAFGGDALLPLLQQHGKPSSRINGTPRPGASLTRVDRGLMPYFSAHAAVASSAYGAGDTKPYRHAASIQRRRIGEFAANLAQNLRRTKPGDAKRLRRPARSLSRPHRVGGATLDLRDGGQRTVHALVHLDIDATPVLERFRTLTRRSSQTALIRRKPANASDLRRSISARRRLPRNARRRALARRRRLLKFVVPVVERARRKGRRPCPFRRRNP